MPRYCIDIEGSSSFILNGVEYNQAPVTATSKPKTVTSKGISTTTGKEVVTPASIPASGNNFSDDYPISFTNGSVITFIADDDLCVFIKKFNNGSEQVCPVNKKIIHSNKIEKMSIVCACGDKGFSGLGIPNCYPGLDVPKYVIFQAPFDKDGNRNYLSPADIADQTAMDALFTDADPLKRLYRLPDLVEYVTERSANETKEYSNGLKKKIRDGIRTITLTHCAPIGGGEYGLHKLLESGNCLDLNFYIVHVCNGISGATGAKKGAIYGVPMGYRENNLVIQSFSNPGENMMTIEVDRNFADSGLSYITGAEFTVDFCNARNPIQYELCCLANVNVGTGGQATILVKSCFGGVGLTEKGDGHVYTGLTATDFALANGNITSVVEVADGEYTISSDATLVGDTITATSSDALFTSESIKELK